MQDGILKAEKVLVSEKKSNYVINETDLVEAEKILRGADSSKIRSIEYYDTFKGIALFQNVHSDCIGDARV